MADYKHRSMDAEYGPPENTAAPMALLQLKASLAGMSYDEQVRAIQPDLPLGVVIGSEKDEGSSAGKPEERKAPCVPFSLRVDNGICDTESEREGVQHEQAEIDLGEERVLGTDLSDEADVINNHIDVWTNQAMFQLTNSCQEAFSGFRSWARSQDNEPRSAAWVTDVLKGAAKVACLFFPEARIALTLARVSLSLLDVPLSDLLTEDVDFQGQIEAVGDRIRSLNEDLRRDFADFSTTLREDDPNLWAEIGLDIVGSDSDLGRAQERLFCEAGVPDTRRVTTEEILAEMILSYLEFVDAESAQYATSGEFIENALCPEGAEYRRQVHAQRAAHQHLNREQEEWTSDHDAPPCLSRL